MRLNVNKSILLYKKQKIVMKKKNIERFGERSFFLHQKTH